MSVVNTRGAVFSIGRRCCVWSGANENTSGPCVGVGFLWCLLEKIDSDLNLKVDRVGISSTEQPLLSKTTLSATLANGFQFLHFKIRNKNSSRIYDSI